MSNLVLDIDTSNMDNLNLVAGTMSGILAKPNEISPDLQDKIQQQTDKLIMQINDKLGTMNSEDQIKALSGVSNMANKVMDSASLMVNIQKENDTDVMAMRSMDNTGGNSSKVSTPDDYVFHGGDTLFIKFTTVAPFDSLSLFTKLLNSSS